MYQPSIGYTLTTTQGDRLESKQPFQLKIFHWEASRLVRDWEASRPSSGPTFWQRDLTAFRPAPIMQVLSCEGSLFV